MAARCLVLPEPPGRSFRTSPGGSITSARHGDAVQRVRRMQTTTTGSDRAERRPQRGIFNYDCSRSGGDGFVAMPARGIRDHLHRVAGRQHDSPNKITGGRIHPAGADERDPGAASGENFRFNWDSPMVLSRERPGTLLVAANRCFAPRTARDSCRSSAPPDDECRSRHHRHNGLRAAREHLAE